MTDVLRSDRIARLSGFGQSDFADGYLLRPSTVEQIQELFHLAKTSGRQVVLRGSGRSYGDAAIASESIVIDCSRLDRILGWDPESGVIDCEGGVTIEGLWRHCLEDGWWPPIVSGTMYPTLGGALGMNIHGKNAYKVGPIGEHVLELGVVTPNGELLSLTPADELFYAVVSGFGMLGAIVRVKLQMKKVDSGNLKVLAFSPRNWQEQIDGFERFRHNSDYMVSWIDCFGGGPDSGRGQFHAAWYEHPDTPDPRTLNVANQDLPDTIMGVFPKSMVWLFLKALNHRFDMRLINWAKDFAGKTLGDGKTHSQSLVAFSFLLDYVPHWEDAYLPGGFIQYQSFVPEDKAHDVFKRQVEMQQEAKLESFLGVMKRHRPDKFLMTHGVEGYSLALDFKVTKGTRTKLFDLCHRMNDVVLAAGGRFYFAKDSTLRPSDVSAYLGEETLAKLRGYKRNLDPNSLLTSRLASRLGLF